MIYFKDKAKELGCSNINSLGDMDVWYYIIVNQSHDHLDY